MTFVGTAGWALPRASADAFPDSGTQLCRYARVFDAVEINSSFRRAHRKATYARWAASVPDSFRFSVKMPKSITHAGRLQHPGAALDTFLSEISELGDRLGCVLAQFPPSLPFVRNDALAFLGALRERYAGDVALEPRHPSWVDEDGVRLLESFQCARVAADPPRFPGGDKPGGWHGFQYWRLHGSRRPYYSSYPPETLAALALRLKAPR